MKKNIILFCSVMVVMMFMSSAQSNEFDGEYMVVPKVKDGSLTMDGKMDEAAWSHVVDNVVGDSAYMYDYYMEFGLLHDEDYLYFFASVEDDWLDYQSGTWNTDAIEIYLDGDDSKEDTWDGINDYQVTVVLGALNDIEGWVGWGDYPRDGIEFTLVETDLGYDVEIALPLSDFEITEVFGIDVALNDADDTGAREDQAWFQGDGQWNVPSSWGSAILSDEMVNGGGGGGNGLPDPNSFFDFEEKDGFTVKDQGTAGNDGEIVGEWIARDSVGVITKEGDGRGCLWWYEENAFGALSYVLVPYAEYMNSPDYTLSTWMMYTGAEPNWGYLFWADGDWWEPDIQDRHIDVWLNPNQGVDCILHTMPEGELRVTTDPDLTGIDIFDGTWHQVTVTLKDNSVYTVYLDGIWAADGEVKGDTEVVMNVGDDMWLGARPNDADATTAVKIVGMMDRVRIWDQALTEAQVGELFLIEGPEGGTKVDDTPVSPQRSDLAGNYPNPFNPTTTIQYSLQSTEKVTLEVFDVLGNRITTLVSDVKNAGEHQAQWNGRDDSGQLVASGVYFYRLTTRNQVATRKMMLMK